MPPNQHDPTKRILAAYITREKYYQIRKLSKQHGISMSALLAILIDRAVRNVTLSPEDYEQIAKEIKQARGKEGGNH